MTTTQQPRRTTPCPGYSGAKDYRAAYCTNCYKTTPTLRHKRMTPARVANARKILGEAAPEQTALPQLTIELATRLRELRNRYAGLVGPALVTDADAALAAYDTLAKS